MIVRYGGIRLSGAGECLGRSSGREPGSKEARGQGGAKVASSRDRNLSTCSTGAATAPALSLSRSPHPAKPSC